MKPYLLSKYRRRFIAELPRLALFIWIIAILLWIMLAANLIQPKKIPTQNIHSLSKRAGHPADPPLTLTPLGSSKPIDARRMIESLPNGLLVWQTYVHESGAGLHDSCRPNGYNGFGYGQESTGNYPCYTSLKEIATIVSNWFTNHLKTMTVKEALCFYNTGRVMDDCDYAEYTLSL